VKRGTWSGTYDDCIELWWGQRQYKRTVPLDPNETNVGTINTAPGYTRYHAFVAQAGLPEGDEFDEELTYEPNEVTDDESDWQSNDADGSDEQEDQVDNRNEPIGVEFDLDGPKQATEGDANDESDAKQISASNEFLRWHHRLGHASPNKIRIMAREGILPKRLARCDIPICGRCTS